MKDSDRNAPIATLKDGDSINLNQLPPRIAVVFEPASRKVRSMTFGLNGVKRFRHETAPPFALAGDSHGRLSAWKPRIGRNTIVVRDDADPKRVHHIQITALKRGPAARSQEGRSASKLRNSNRGKSMSGGGAITPEAGERASIGRESLLDLSTNPIATSSEDVKGDSITPQSPSDTLTEQSVAPVQNRFTLKSVPNAAPGSGGTCISILNKASDTVELICSHTLAHPVASRLIHRRSAGEDEKIICDLGNPLSPIIGSCPLNVDQRRAFDSGELVVRVDTAEHPDGEIFGVVE